MENDVVRSVCEYLAIRRYFFWRQNTAPRFDKTKGIYFRMPAYSKKGVPDIIVVKHGVFIGLECKTAKTKQSDDQKEFEDGLKTAGGEYYVVRGIEDVQKIGL